MLAAMMASGQVAQKKEAPSQQQTGGEENLEAALDAPVEEDVMLEVNRDTNGARGRVHRQASASESSQQDTLADEDVQRSSKAHDAPLKK